LGTNVTPATGIGYGFTTDEFAGGLIYFISGASKGLIRTITANNNDSTTGGTVTYSGAALSVSAGDWFIILPPTNFRWLGDILNKSTGDICPFVVKSNGAVLKEASSAVTITTAGTESTLFCPPMASMILGKILLSLNETGASPADSTYWAGFIDENTLVNIPTNYFTVVGSTTAFMLQAPNVYIPTNGPCKAKYVLGSIGDWIETITVTSLGYKY
jgi:hypothetical protein